MKEKEQYLEFFQNLADDLADHVSELSDAEILESAKEHNEDPKGRALSLKKKINFLVMENRRKRKLEPAQKKYTHIAENCTLRERFLGKPIEELKAIISKNTPKADMLPSGLIFAGRNLDELTESDLLNVLEDMHDLGLLKNE